MSIRIPEKSSRPWNSGRWFALSVIVVGGVLGSCEQDDGPKIEKELVPIQLGSAPAAPLLLPTLVGMAEGYFEAEGVEIRELILGPGNNTRTGLISGDLDFGLLAFVHVPLARARGQELKIIGELYSREIFSLMVRSSLRDSVQQVGDLKGKRIGVAAVGAGNWAAAYAILKKAGLNPDADVEFISIGNNLQAVYNSMRSERIDAYPAFEPETSILLKENVAFALVPMWERNVHARWVGQSAMAMTLAAHEDLIARDPVLVQRVVNAHRLSMVRIKSGEPRDLAALLQEEEPKRVREVFGEISRGDLAAMIGKLQEGFGWLSLGEDGYETMLANYLSSHVLSERVEFLDAVDWRFAGLEPDGRP